MAHGAGAYLRFLYVKRIRVFDFPLDETLIHRRLAPSRCWYSFTYQMKVFSIKWKLLRVTQIRIPSTCFEHTVLKNASNFCFSIFLLLVCFAWGGGGGGQLSPALYGHDHFKIQNAKRNSNLLGFSSTMHLSK